MRDAQHLDPQATGGDAARLEAHVLAPVRRVELERRPLCPRAHAGPDLKGVRFGPSFGLFPAPPTNFWAGAELPAQSGAAEGPIGGWGCPERPLVAPAGHRSSAAIAASRARCARSALCERGALLLQLLALLGAMPFRLDLKTSPELLARRVRALG